MIPPGIAEAADAAAPNHEWIPFVYNPSIPAQATLNQAFASENGTIAYFNEKGFGFEPLNCYRCGNDRISDRENSRNGKTYRCNAKACRYNWSIFKNTFFEKVRTGANKVLHIAYLWLQDTSLENIATTVGVNSSTVTAWTKCLRELITWDMDSLGQTAKIGGEGIIVEIDESKFGKRKYNVGHHVEGVWVVGGVERTEQRKMFAVAVDNRNALTLRNVIEAYVNPGSIIYTDCWKGYVPESLAAIGMFHDTVNHSIGFVSPTGVHTNHIEGTWAGIKIKIPRQHRTRKFVDGDLIKFIWKRQFKGQLWNRLVRAMGTVRYTDEHDDILEQLPDDLPVIPVGDALQNLQLHDDADSEATEPWDEELEDDNDTFGQMLDQL